MNILLPSKDVTSQVRRLCRTVLSLDARRHGEAVGLARAILALIGSTVEQRGTVETNAQWKAFEDKLPANDGRAIYWYRSDDACLVIVAARDFCHEDKGWWAEIPPYHWPTPLPDEETPPLLGHAFVSGPNTGLCLKCACSKGAHTVA